MLLREYYTKKFLPRMERKFSRGKIKAKTLAEYKTAWVHIRRKLGSKSLHDIDYDMCEEFFDWLTDKKTPRVRQRCMAKLKEMMAHAVVDREIPTSPCALIKNPMPKGRTQYWLKPEIDELVAKAEDLGMHSMALVIRVMYETARSPVDARELTMEDIKRDNVGAFVARDRQKTSVASFQPLSNDLYADIMAYAGNIKYLPGTKIFRRHKPARQSRQLIPWRTDSAFSKDFALVREAAFGSDEKRQARDLRRTANLEALLGGASPEERARLLSNGLDKSGALDQVYTPPTLHEARQANLRRQAGAAILRGAA